MRLVEINLPFPPSVNTMFRNVPGKGRVKTGKYAKWRIAAGLLARSKWKGEPSESDCEVWIELFRPDHKTRDLDNYIKAVLDSLSGIVFVDDNQVKQLTIWWTEDRPTGGATVTVRPYKRGNALKVAA